MQFIVTVLNFIVLLSSLLGRANRYSEQDYLSGRIRCKGGELMEPKNGPKKFGFQ